MKFICQKNNKFKKTERNKGFALLFSVLIASLLLTIGLSIFSTTLKELAISTASRQSVYAFYAADSGRECVKYWDTKKGQIPGLFSDLIADKTGTISCGNSGSIPIVGIYAPNPDDFPSEAGSVTVRIPSEGSISVTNDLDGPDFYVEVTKSIIDRGASISATNRIDSYGHDSAGGDRVERAIRQNY